MDEHMTMFDLSEEDRQMANYICFTTNGCCSMCPAQRICNPVEDDL